VLFTHQRVADQQDVKIKLSPEVFIRHPAKEPRLREGLSKSSGKPDTSPHQVFPLMRLPHPAEFLT
jgi:hypothetical protein